MYEFVELPKKGARQMRIKRLSWKPLLLEIFEEDSRREKEPCALVSLDGRRCRDS